MEHYHQSQQNLPFMLEALYCEEVETEECFRDEEDESFDKNQSLDPKPPLLSEQDFSWEDEELSTLLSKAQENQLFNCLENNPSLVEARREAVDWMLKVVAHYSFSASTAVLAVNYLDRFLFSFQSHSEKPWMTQLAAVACLSLAAKVEETQVPLLLDLQVEESKYVFEAKTIQRMEILVLSTLEWKMNPVTPLSFLDYITRRLGLKTHLSWEFLRRCECLLLAVIHDCRFMCYLPSVMATATMLQVINNIEPCTLVEFQDQLLSILGINKEKMEACCSLIHEVASSVDFYTSNKRKFGALPGSPKGVMDVSFSSDSSNDSWAAASSSSSSSSSPPSVSSSTEPLSKKIRTLEQPLEEDVSR